MYKIMLKILVLSLSLFSTQILADDEVSVPETEISFTTHDDNEVTGYHYPAQGDTLILWIGSSYNFNKKVYRMSNAFAEQGLEIWLIDFAEALFTPKSSNFMRNLDARYIADLITSAHEQTGKKIILMTRAYGSIPTMRGATLWQQQNPDKDFLTGAILFSPDFYKSIPELGLDPEYLPITSQTTLPMVIFQGGRRGTAWQFPKVVNKLRETNNNVYLKIMPGISGVFYINDTNPPTLEQIKRLPHELPQVIKMLEVAEHRKQPGAYQQPVEIAASSPDIKLKPFNGNPNPPLFALQDIQGQTYEFSNKTNKVLVVNFWATWCPPCVEEIPSLNRLKQKMKDKPFELISINYAEPKPLIKNFLKRVNVEFPVLLDHDKRVSGDWNVVAFPSTFVVGPDGKIHYGVNAAILWDSPEVISTLDALMKQ